MEKETLKPEVDVKEPLELVKEVQKELADYRRPFEKEWREYDNAYYGKQHKTGESKKSVKNHIFKIIEGEVPILTDSMPGTQVDAELADKQVDADVLNKAIRYVYQDQNLPLIQPTLVRSGLISAPGYLYAFYNPDADGGDGKIEYKQLPWEYVYLDGNAQTIEQAERGRIEIPMRREAIARMWPEKRNEVMGVNPNKQETSSFDDSENFETRDISSGDESRGKPSKAKAKDIIKYSETWIKSYDLEPISDEETAEELAKERAQFTASEVPNIGKWENHDAHMQDHAAQRAEVLSMVGLPGDAPFEQVSQAIDQLLAQNPQAEQLSSVLLTVKMIDNHLEEHAEMKKLNPSGERPKYKDGWRIIKSVDNVLLYDGANPEERMGIGHIPIVPFYGYKDDTIYGFGEVKNIIDAQRSLNDMDQRELEGLRVNANSGWVADHEAEVDENQLTNEPGIVIKKKKGTEVRRFEPGQVSPQLTQRKELDENAMEQISGMNEATQGQLPSSGASGVTVQKLQTQAIGRIRLKDRYLQHYSMRRLAIITAQLILNHWTTEKQFRLRGENSQIEDVVFDPIRMQDLGYSISISPGSMAGLDKDAMNALYIQLFQLGAASGAMTFEDLLMIMDFPKREMLLAKLKERAQEAQAIEELQSQIQELQTQNSSIVGLINPALLESEQKQIYEVAMKQALLEKVMSQQQPQPETQGNEGAINGQPDSQGMM
jgi:hypothetical protein